MAERATFCPRCKRMHVGVCPQARQRPSLPVAVADPKIAVSPASDTPSPQIQTAKAKFDKTAYQRDYMRRKRAEKLK